MAKGGKLVTGNAIISGNPGLPEIVYCYQFPSRRDRIKIGYSSRGLRRIVEQSTGFPEVPEVLFVIHHPNAAEIEKQLHKSLSDKQAPVLGNEWFGATIKDVLKVSPLLRKAARKQRWRSVPRLFSAGAFFGVGLFVAPVIALGVMELCGAGGSIAGWEVFKDYLKSPFSAEIATFDLAKAIFEHFSLIGMPEWLRIVILASPTAWVGLAYFSFHRQVA